MCIKKEGGNRWRFILTFNYFSFYKITSFVNSILSKTRDGIKFRIMSSHPANIVLTNRKRMAKSFIRFPRTSSEERLTYLKHFSNGLWHFQIAFCQSIYNDVGLRLKSFVPSWISHLYRAFSWIFGLSHFRISDVSTLSHSNLSGRQRPIYKQFDSLLFGLFGRFFSSSSNSASVHLIQCAASILV